MARTQIGFWAVMRDFHTLTTLVLSWISKFSRSFDEVFRTEGARVIKTPIRAPKASAFAERWVRTARRECLDHLLILGRRHLERVLREFVMHYNASRPHRGPKLAYPTRQRLRPAPTAP